MLLQTVGATGRSIVVRGDAVMRVGAVLVPFARRPGVGSDMGLEFKHDFKRLMRSFCVLLGYASCLEYCGPGLYGKVWEADKYMYILSGFWG